MTPGGRFLAVEVKAHAGRLAPEQSAFLEKVRGWKELDQALRREGYADDGPLFSENALPYGEA